VAVVQLRPWEVVDQQMQPGGPFLTIGRDEQLDAFRATRLRAGVDLLLRHNAVVVIVLPPDTDMGRIDGKSPDPAPPESDGARMERFREIVSEVASSSSGVQTVDVNQWLQHRSDERSLRPDGIHFTEHAAQTAARWLAPRLLQDFKAATGRSATQLVGG
jgi:lysophospholipase L1-like esterase